MEPSNWAPEYSGALHDYVLKGLSFSKIAREINKAFGTTYTKSAVRGRARRMGLAVQPQVASPSIVPALGGGEGPAHGHSAPAGISLPRELQQPPESAFRPADPVKLRCVGIRPRLISLTELEPGDCRYPYGGDKEGDEIAFCGHPRRAGSSYCAPHFHLTLGSDAASERTAGQVVLRVVAAA